MFPYRNNVVQIRVNDSWIEHAEAHAQARRQLRDMIKASNWDISQRLGDIALRYFLHKLGATDAIGGLEVGERPANPTTRGNLVLAISCAPADERYNMGAKAELRVFKNWAGSASIHVAGLYDPPYVDMLGWADTQAVLTRGDDGKGKSCTPAAELRTMSELIRIIAKENEEYK